MSPGAGCKQCPHCGDWVPLSDPCPFPVPLVDEDGIEEGVCAHAMVASDPEAFALGAELLLPALSAERDSFGVN